MRDDRPTGGGAAWYLGLHRLESRVVSIEKVLCAAALASMTIATALAVVIRNLNLPLPNLSEIGLVAMVPLTLIGGSLCTYLAAHIAVDFIQTSRSRPLILVAELAVAVATVAFALVYFRSGLFITDEFLSTGDKLLDLGTPLWSLAVFFPIGMALMTYHALMRILTLMMERGVPLRQVEETGDSDR